MTEGDSTLMEEQDLELTEEQIQEIIDRFADRSDVEEIALKMGLPKRYVRLILDNPELAYTAIRRKKSSIALWFGGRVFDLLQDIILSDESTSQRLAAIRLLREMIVDPPPRSAPQEEKKQLVASIEEAIDRVGS